MKKIIILIMLMGFTTSAFAFGVKPSSGLSLSAGPGIGLQEEYSGSENLTANFIPYIDTCYTIDEFTAFLSVSDGLGGKYNFGYPGLFVSGGVNLGNSRSPGDSAILKDTAKITNNATCFIKTGYESGFFDFVFTTQYYPISMHYNSASGDEKKNGIMGTISCIAGYPVLNNLLVSTEIGLSAGNADYAQVYYGVKHATQKLKAYNPGAGINRFYCEPTVIFFTGYNISINIQGHYERLLFDAAKSPMVKRENSFTGLTYVSYDI